MERQQSPTATANLRTWGPMEGLIARLSWMMALTEVLLNEERGVPREGVEIAARWPLVPGACPVHSQQPQGEVAATGAFPGSGSSPTWGSDAAKAASLSGLTPEQFGEWLSERSEADFHRAPALARIREVLHLRLSNSDDKWEANDLNDLLFLATAATRTS